MDPQTIRFLVKFFSEENHARAFMDGNLLARRLSWFKKLEDMTALGDQTYTKG